MPPGGARARKLALWVGGEESVFRRSKPVLAAAFALRLARKDVLPAVNLGRELGVPMRLANLALEELRAGVEIRVPPERLRDVLEKG
jgi:3-hydroxyisobutyrate dehydrogenase-like beta-hydroxyacid dehydrogenase